MKVRICISKKPFLMKTMPQRESLVKDMLHRLRARCQRLVVVLVSGRPLILTEQLPMIDALVAAWLPGTEALGVTDVLFGDHPFTGRLPFSWARNSDQLPLAALKASAEAPLWRCGDGLG